MPREDRLARMEEQLRLKHPKKSEKAIKLLAADLIRFESGDPTLIDTDREEREYHERLEREQRESINPDEGKDQSTNSKDLKALKNRTIEELSNNPKYSGLFKVTEAQKPKPSKLSAIDQPDRVGRAKLHWAAYHGDMDLVIELVEKRGARTDLPDHGGKTPRAIALREGHTIIARYLARK